MSGLNVAIITSATDGYDTLKRGVDQFGANVEWIAVTDGTEVVEDGAPWEIMSPEPFATDADMTHPNRLAKIAKCMPWHFTDAPYVIWIDASYRVTSPLFAVQAVNIAQPLAQFVHPWRECVYTEATASRELLRYADQKEVIKAQVNEYEEIGHPANWGLWATGVIVRKRTTDTEFFGQQWLSEIRRWSYQDQLSEPVVLRMCDLRPAPLPGDHITNPWLKYEGSARH